MRRREKRVRSLVKGACVATAAVVGAIYLASFWFYVGREGWHYAWVVRGGAVALGRLDQAREHAPERGFGRKRAVSQWLPWANDSPRGWFINRVAGWELPYGLPGMDYPKWRKGWLVSLPLWIPFALVALPTAWLCRRDLHRVKPGHCRTCGYNLTGNVSGRCPECGEAVGG